MTAVLYSLLDDLLINERYLQKWHKILNSVLHFLFLSWLILKSSVFCGDYFSVYKLGSLVITLSAIICECIWTLCTFTECKHERVLLTHDKWFMILNLSYTSLLFPSLYG